MYLFLDANFSIHCTNVCMLFIRLYPVIQVLRAHDLSQKMYADIFHFKLQSKCHINKSTELPEMGNCKGTKKVFELQYLVKVQSTFHPDILGAGCVQSWVGVSVEVKHKMCNICSTLSQTNIAP